MLSYVVRQFDLDTFSMAGCLSKFFVWYYDTVGNIQVSNMVDSVFDLYFQFYYTYYRIYVTHGQHAIQ